MDYNGLLLRLPSGIKWFIGIFVLVLSIGFSTGLLFISKTTAASSTGLVENYLGNEENPEAEIMKFKKEEREMLTIVHTHILSMSLIFFTMGILVWMTNIPTRLKTFLSTEPLLSTILTFGGIYLMWSGLLWMKYVVIVSGILMSSTFGISVIIVLYQLIKKPDPIR